MDTNRIAEPVRLDVLARLKRAEGQVRGVIRALESGGDCQQTVRQLAAAKSALERAGVKLVSGGLIECMQDDPSGGAIGEFEKMLLELA